MLTIKRKDNCIEEYKSVLTVSLIIINNRNSLQIFYTDVRYTL